MLLIEINFDSNLPVMTPEAESQFYVALPGGINLYPILAFDNFQYSWDAAPIYTEALEVFQLRLLENSEFLNFKD